MCDVSECKVFVSEHIMLCLRTYFTLSQNGNFVVSEHEVIVSTWYIMHRLGLVISSSRNMKSSSLNGFCIDVSNVFLNGDINADMYMQQLKGFVIGACNILCKLQKGLYGTKHRAHA